MSRGRLTTGKIVARPERYYWGNLPKSHDAYKAEVNGTEYEFTSGVVYDHPPVTLYKFTRENGTVQGSARYEWSLPTQNPDGTWTPGDWMEPAPVKQGTRAIHACSFGLHLFDARHLATYQGYGPSLWEAEVEGPVVHAHDKWVAARVRLVRGVKYTPVGMDWQAKQECIARAEREVGRGLAAELKPMVEKAIASIRDKAPELVAKDFEEALASADKSAVYRVDHKSLKRYEIAVLRAKLDQAEEKIDWDEFIKVTGEARRTRSKERRYSKLASSLVNVLGDEPVATVAAYWLYPQDRLRWGSPTYEDRYKKVQAIQVQVNDLTEKYYAEVIEQRNQTGEADKLDMRPLPRED